MPPISYQGPMAKDEHPGQGHSQSMEVNMGVDQPGVTVAAILDNKGDEVHTVAPHTSVRDVVGHLARLRIGALVVVDSANEPIGIVSERDITRSTDVQGLSVFEQPVEDIMTKDLKVCAPNDKIEDVLKRMDDGGFRHMPVTEGGQLVGMVSMRDVARHRIMEVEYEYLKMKQAVIG